ncbi:MAG TPA: hypothetical protein VK966_05005, partial [Longimicrobiales bacterium]|nr:hypothetical protein [Longimicrobiales bacterium]
REIVAELGGAGRTVLLASHELPEVERLADRVILLRDGRVQEVVTMESPGGPFRYRLEVDATDQLLEAAFPGAGRAPDGVLVTVADHREMSDRLAVLLDGGATVRSVLPLGAELEDRVRRGLDGEEPA